MSVIIAAVTTVGYVFGFFVMLALRGVGILVDVVVGTIRSVLGRESGEATRTAPLT